MTEAESTRWTTARILFVMVKDDADGPSHLKDILSYLSCHVLDSYFRLLRTKKTCSVQADDVPSRCNRTQEYTLLLS